MRSFFQFFGPTSFPAKSYNFLVMTGVFDGFTFSIVRTCSQRGATICSKQDYNFELTLLALSTCQIRMSAYAGKPMLCPPMTFALRMLLCLRWVIRNSKMLLYVIEMSELLGIFDVLTVVLLKIQVFWEVTLCHWVSNSFWWKDRSAFIVRVKQSMTTWPWRWMHCDLLNWQHSILLQKIGILIEGYIFPSFC